MNKNVKKSKKESNKFLDMITKYKMYVISAIFVVIFVALYLIFGLNGKSYAIDSDEYDHLILDCPSTVTAGSEFECSYGFNVVTITGMSFQVNPVLKDKSEIDNRTNLEFLGHENSGICNDNSCISGENGLVYFSMVANLTGRNIVGKLKYRVPSDALPGEEYGIILIDGMIAGSNGNNEDAEVDFEDKSVIVKVASDVNTLSDITLSSGVLNEQVTTNNTNYTATVDSDKVTINVAKTDANSSVTGNLENVSLHYGTNVITFSVFSETGVEKVYTITITRPYEFSTDSYIYNSTDNYLYTRTDTDSDTIISNISLENGLTASVSNNKYIIKYGSEELKSINLINVNFGNYNLSDGFVYLGASVDVSEFKSSVNANGVIVKVYNGNNEVSSGELTSDHKIRIYHGSTLLEEYNITSEYLEFSDKLVVDDTKNIIKRIPIQTTSSSLKDNVDTSGIVLIKDKNGDTLKNSDIVKTGDVVTIKVGNVTKTYTISVLGDINGDGRISVSDVSRMYRYVKRRLDFSDAEFAASDILNDGNVEIREVSRLYRYVKGRIDEL